MNWFIKLLTSKKIAIIALVVTCTGIFQACSSSSNDVKNKSNSSSSSSIANAGENISISLQQPDSSNLRNIFIESKKVGLFEIGDLIHSVDIPSGFGISDASSERPTEEGITNEPLSILSYQDTEIYEILWDYDIETENFVPKVGEIRVTSNIPQTIDQIKVGSTLTDLGKVYPLELWYSYVGDMFVATTDEFQDVQFLLDPAGYVGTKELFADDIVFLEFSDFNSDTKVNKIRIY
ncbi:MAG: hypothetical protein AAGA80_12840 [Cyanobacteria bacterium P01_F01_bin.143]